MIPAHSAPTLGDLAGFAQQLAQSLRELLAKVPRSGCGASARNAKGDIQERFDVTAHEFICEALRQKFHGGEVLSEEAEMLQLGPRSLPWRFVIDPIDGSDNYRAGLPLSAACIAAINVQQPLSVQAVAWSIVINVDVGSQVEPYVAVRGQGAWCGSRRLQTSGVRRTEDAVISLELNQCAIDADLDATIRRAKAIRSYCSTAAALALIAAGKLDAHLDQRWRVTPESYLAAALLVTEAGGDFRVTHGLPITGLTDCRPIISGATIDLVEELRIGNPLSFYPI